MNLSMLFNKLTLDREENAKIFAKPSMAGFNRLLSDMYAEKAHYIYELIQNADDANASEIKFILKKTELYFSHNGTVKFTLTDPDSESLDSENGRLGHINSITSVGNTTKNEQKIGKFGIGFKSVFQYTDSPIIQDDNFSFQIKNLFVPYSYSKKFNHRSKGDTLFVIPFTKDAIAYEDTKTKFELFDETILLFLRNIQQIHFQYSGIDKIIRKKSFKTENYSTYYSNFSEVKTNLIKIEANRYLQFRANIKHESIFNKSFDISLVYPVNKQNHFESEREYNAYCFFPTQEKTGLKFALHAPFLLTDNRQNIKKDTEWNEFLINSLADLVFESVLLMRNLKYLNTKFFYSLPLDTDKYSDNYYNRELFFPIFENIQNVFTSQQVIPTPQGNYIYSKESFLIRVKEIEVLLKNEEMSELKDLPNASIIFPEITESGKASKLWTFLKDILFIKVIDAKEFLRLINKAFITRRNDEWLKAFYKYCLAISSMWEELKDKEIIRLENGEVIKPFINGIPQVFLQDIDPEYPHIKSIFLEDEHSIKFFKNLGISIPNKRDVIFRTVIKRYGLSIEEVNYEDNRRDFDNILSFFNECSFTDRKDLVKQLQDTKFILGSSKNSIGAFYAPKNLYLKSNILDLYFENYYGYSWFDEQFYEELFKKYDRATVYNFLHELGVSEIPKIIKNHMQSLGNLGIYKYSTQNKHEIDDYILEGFNDFKQDICPEKSNILWNYLLELTNGYKLQEHKNGKAVYYYYKKIIKNFTSTLYNQLSETEWIYCKNGELHKPSDIFIDELDTRYSLTNSTMLIKELGIKDEKDSYSNLPEEVKKKLDFVNNLINTGINFNDLYIKLPELKDIIIDYLTIPSDFGEAIKNNNEEKRISKKIIKEKKSLRVNLDELKETSVILKEDIQLRNNEKKQTEVDDDELIPKIQDSAELLNSLKRKFEIEAEKLNRLQSLKEQINEAEKYSYSWFKILLELEFFDRKDREIRKGSLHVSFKNIQQDPFNKGILILSGADYIPLAIEDNESLTLKLSYKDYVKPLIIDSVSRQNKILKVRLISNSDTQTLDIEQIEYATIEIKNANFLFENLRESFNYFSENPFFLPETYNFKKELPKNISIIFGPPGTGKTTYLAEQIIYPLCSNTDVKMLVLAPTNKAADVLIDKLLAYAKSINDLSYLSWLIRFGTTNDPLLEGLVYHNTRKLDKNSLNKLTLVTTVARFTYDFFEIETKNDYYQFYLKDYDWDYILFDESSMINLPSTVFPLFYRSLQKSDTKFIFCGDPFQIEPIVYTKAEGWEGGNIFSLIELNQTNSFNNPKPNPEYIKITPLISQYRSIPQIGSLYSQLTYNNKLVHKRDFSCIRKISINNIDLQPITFIKFKIDENDSIFRAHKLQESPYHIYSTLFIVELIEYIINNININDSRIYNIGIICPYRAQQNIIDKLISSLKIPEHLSILTGTVHGFQGDECDMIFSIFNPPQNVNNSNNFLNRHNLINVAISRAKDYLIVLEPYDPTEKINVNNLHIIKKIKSICKEDPEINKVIKSYYDYEIEKIIFGNSNFIENISFSTAHQEVNVYSTQDHKYEIRYDKNALDIRIIK